MTLSQQNFRAATEVAPTLRTAPNATTNEAAAYLNLQPQTLRKWACEQRGPIKPVRIGGRLGWPWAALETVAGVQK